jgi:hypothetical protein
LPVLLGNVFLAGIFCAPVQAEFQPDGTQILFFLQVLRRGAAAQLSGIQNPEEPIS